MSAGDGFRVEANLGLAARLRGADLHAVNLGRARQIVAVQQGASSIGPGMYREAVEAGRAPAWVESNLGALEVIEAKIYNRHRFLENLSLALRFPGRIPR